MEGMPVRSLPITAAAVGCTLLLVSGCSDSSDNSDSSDSSDSATVDAQSTVGPLEAYLKPLIDADDEADQAKLRVEMENVIAECMQDAGFDYKPQEIPSDFFKELEEGPEYGSEEYAREMGYGTAGTPADDEQTEWVDPNADYVESMSESERAAWDLALYGPEQQEPLEGEEEPVSDGMPESCSTKGYQETYGNTMAAWQDPAHSELLEEMDRTWQKVQSDSQLAELDVQWSDCMNEAGFDFEKPDDAEQSVREAYDTLYNSQDPEATPDPAAEDELREQELATAIADAECKTKVGYRETFRKVQFAAEQKFVDEHKAELDAWIEQYATDDAAAK